jgi:hypothetical protein
MTVQQTDVRVPAQRTRLAPGLDPWTGGVIACVDSHVSPALLAASAAWATAHDAPVLLYVTDSARHRFASLRPTRWSGDGTRVAYEHPLGAVELYVLGQRRIAEAVAELTGHGLRAAGWLPACGEAPLATYVAQRAARAVVVAACDHDSLVCLRRFQLRSRPMLELVRV